MWFSIDRLKDERKEMARQLDKLWDWKDGHDKWAGETRSSFEKNQAKLDGRVDYLENSIKDQYHIIVDRIDKSDRMVESQFKRLEDKIDSMDGRRHGNGA
jgi:predicted metal-dependent peptidase